MTRPCLQSSRSYRSPETDDITRLFTDVGMNNGNEAASERIEVDRSYLGLLLMELTRKFQQMHDDRTERHKKLGLRASFSGVLTNLAERPHRLSELAEINRMRPQSMVKLVNELEALAYVERIPDPSDARAKLVRFTAEGKRTVDIARETSKDIYALYAELVGEEDLRHMLSTMSRLIRGLDS